MNRSEIRTQVRTLLNEPTAGFWSDANLNSHIDMAVQHLSSIISSVKEDYFTGSSTFSTVSGIKSYSMPTNCRFIRRMEIYKTTDSSYAYKLEQLKFPRIEGRGDWPFGATGEPTNYIVRGTQFDLLPIPNAVYTMRIYFDQRQTSLSTDGESPNAPTDFHDMIVYWACVLADLQNSADPKIFVDLFNARKKDLVETLISRGSDDPNPVEGYLEQYI